MKAGVMLAQMAVADTALNVEANLPLIKTAAEHERMADAAKELKKSLLTYMDL